MSRSKAQQFAQQRNSAGGCLKGVLVNLEKTIKPKCSSYEKQRLKIAITELKDLHKDWSDNYERAKNELL